MKIKIFISDIDLDENISRFSTKFSPNDTKIIKNVDNYIFLLNMNQLYAININAEEKINSIYVGELLQLDELPENVVVRLFSLFNIQTSKVYKKKYKFQIEVWLNALLIVVNVKKYQQLFVYVVHSNFQENIQIEPINKIDLPSHLSELELIKKPNDLYLVALLKNGENTKLLK